MMNINKDSISRLIGIIPDNAVFPSSILVHLESVNTIRVILLDIHIAIVILRIFVEQLVRNPDVASIVVSE